MKYFFKNDNFFCCNETSFFTFDDSLLEFAVKLVTERELIFDSHEPEHDNIHSGRLPCRIIPITGFLKYMGLFTYFNKKKEKVYSIMKYLLRHHISKLFDIRLSNAENIAGLCMIFERTFLKAMNQLYIHLRSLDIYPVDQAG